MTTPVIVTGMHRSGTSLIASLLAAWNVRMGDRLLPADRGNPAGYFEDVEFLDLNRRILAACTPDEAGHRDWGWTASGTFDESQASLFRDEAAALVAAREDGPAWGWKDPRTSMLLDFWDGVLRYEGQFLLLYRHPWEVADSMLRTGAQEWLAHPDYPARIWTDYNRRLLDFHGRHRERSLLVSANRVLRDPAAFAALVQRHCDISAAADALADLRLDDAFVTHADDDPLPRLWRVANPEALELLGALDDAADLGNDRTWEPGARKTPARTERPRLSVIIPCHNDGDYVIEAMASAERYAPSAEIVVVDDGSTQARTIEVLGSLREAGYRVIRQAHAGLSAARNAGIAASAGEYFLPLDADNRILPGFVDEAIRLLDGDPAAGIVYGDRREFGARTADVAVPEFDLAQMLWSNSIDACAVVRREVWSDVSGYEESLRDWEDWDFWLGAAERGWRFLRLPRPAFEYRIRPGSLHQRFLRGDAYMPTLRRVYDRHRGLVPPDAAAVLVTAHAERRRLLDDTAALQQSRDRIQTEIDRLAASRHDQIEALSGELASVKFVLQARDEELAALRERQAETSATDGPLTGATSVFTIVARNYLAYARVLAASLARHNPGTRLHVILLDDDEGLIAAEPAMEIIRAGELPFDPPSTLHTMAAIYDVTELATAVKPWAFRYLFARGAEVAIYLDPDIEIFDALGTLESQARAHGMLLTPHITEPLPADGKRPNEQDLLLAGTYNLGFLALSAEASAAFLDWWAERLRRHCLNDPARGLFVDQRWIDFAPALFEPGIVDDPGYNVAYWNLPHRTLERDGDRIAVNGKPLRFFHFSGFSPRARHLLSKHQHDAPRIRLSDSAILTGLCGRYAAALEAAGFEETSALPYGFAATGNGLPLDTWARRALRRTYLDDERGSPTEFPNPFSPDGADDVVQRLLRPSPHSSAISAYLGELWSDRADLRLAFPRVDAADAERFLDWVRTQGVREHAIPAQLVPQRTGEGRPHASPAATLQRGVNVYGYAFAESGTGQIVRSVVAALAAAGIPYAVVPFTRTVSRQQREFTDLGTATPSFDTNLICVNADQVPLFFESMRGRLLPGARNIGLWAWEVEDLPPAMAASERYLDEVWGISEFTAATLRRSVTKPVRAFPLPVVVPAVRKRTRAELGMPEGFLFLFCFDHDSVFRRKNPIAVVDAFRRAFGDRSDVVLFVKTTNAGRHAAEAEALHAAARGRANVVIRDAYVANDDYFSMLDACDCYVSLHRSEGFGLTVAEAMALGKPVISTAYSSTVEFTDDANSHLVPVRLVPVGGGAPPYPPQSRWAEPDVGIAAEKMLRVFEQGAESAAMAARARADIETLHGPAARGALLRELLEQHRRETALLTPGETPAGTGVEFEANALAAESLLGSPRADLPSPLQRLMTPLRGLVLRFIRVYWVQQLGVDRAILAALRALHRESRTETLSLAATVRQQSASLERANADAARMSGELAELTAEVRALSERLEAMLRPRPVERVDDTPGIHSAKPDQPTQRGRHRG